MKYNAIGSKCGDESTGSLSDDNTTTYDTYGRLYDWETAMEVCPSDWHLPSKDEWAILEEYPATELKATSGWFSGNGTDNYGFAALPGGGGGGYFWSFGYLGLWWSSSDYDVDEAYYQYMEYSNLFGSRNNDKSTLYSVRCVQD